MKCFRYIFLFGIVLSFVSCNRFKGSQEIPAYLKIEPWDFTTNYEIYGAATSAITDAWVYVDGNLLGCYEYKNHDDGRYVIIPVLEKGSHDLFFEPGIKENGIASTRVHYRFYKPYECRRTLVEGEIETITPSTTYKSIDSTDMRIKMIEDFEEINNIRIYRIDSTYAELHQVSHRTDQNAWMDPLDTINRYRSGHVHLGDSITKMGLASGELTDLPNMNKDVMMEMDYKCDAEILIGMYILHPQDGLLDKELYYLRSASDWKKVYINFTPTVGQNSDATYFKFYLKSAVEAGGEADLYFDNIKLIYLDN